MKQAVLLALMFVLPGATALELQLQEPELPLQPGLNQVDMRASIIATCTEILPLLDPATMTARANVAFDTHPELVISGPQEIVLDGTLCLVEAGTANIGASTIFQVGATRSAPGVVPIPIDATATVASQNPASPGTLSAEDSTTALVNFYGLAQLKITNALITARPGDQVAIEMVLENFGNALTEYTFSSDAEGFNAPAPIRLAPPGANGTSQMMVTAYVDVPADVGWNNDELTITLDITSRAVDDPSQSGNPLTGNVLVRKRGFATVGDNPVVIPGPGIPLLLLAGAVAIGLRRRA